MRFHLLGVGSIGSLFATHLSALDSAQVRLILRRKDLAAQLLNPSTSTDPSRHPHGTIKLERDGLVRKTTNLEMELTRSPAESMSTQSSSRSNRRTPTIDPSVWLRNDPIETLIVTTKAPQTLPALRHILPRLSSRSTIVLCQNGMGTLEGLLERYWPEDRSDEIEREREQDSGSEDRWRVGLGGGGGRPSFICATTTHGAWRKGGGGHFVHAGMGDVKFGVLPNRAVLSAISNCPEPSWSNPAENPILNPRSLVDPILEHLPLTPITSNLRTTISSLLSCTDLKPIWLSLPTLQTAQLQKLAVNASVNSLTALMGVNTGALIGSQKAISLIDTVSKECGQVFAAHLAREAGTWSPTPPSSSSALDANHDEANSPESSPSPPPLPHHHPLSPESLRAYTLSVLFKTSSNLSSTLSDLLPLQQSTTFTLDNSPSLPSRTEIEFINGYITALGTRYGIETPVVKALGEMVLLKEEMGRVGAIDKVWQGRATPSTSVGAGGSQSRRERRPSIFSSSSSSSGSGSDSRSTTSRGGRGIPEEKKSHARAEKYDRIRRESEDRSRSREIERIQRERGHGEGG
ncbi:2-dehydropantoate 2-reductase PAN5 [Sporobolomyces salmoneus]|uniref:2-dehydropantoate 2-reductase PAN5 n=1 Tax=Sporobolomyces salmoneus TaxID=183962 RepID=UPI003176D873